ncbi:MAG: isoprenyl transferase [Chitinophagaceae bacterium]
MLKNKEAFDISTINIEKIPQHIAIIMDGNGRWAKQQKKNRLLGHLKGVDSVNRITTTCGKLGIKYLTLYTFSTENWKRPKNEVSGLMTLLANTLEKKITLLQENNVRLHIIGFIDTLPNTLQRKLKNAIEKTSSNNGLQLIMALNYSGRSELAYATKKIIQDITQGYLSIEKINEQTIKNYLFTHSFPDPELLIRTGGEYRISNFLLYQIAYSELFFTPVLWPDFNEQHLYEAIIEYQNRERRFGKISEQIKKSNT